jgi:phosphatidylserine decarboxylase
VIAKGAGYWIAIPLIMGVASIVISIRLESYVVYILANVFFLASIAVIIMFRDPPRGVGKGVVSPADGRVRVISRDRNSVTISTALHRVHVNRAPIDGRVLRVDESKQVEGAVEISIASEIGIVGIRQRPRSFPKAIICYVSRRRPVKKGQRIGIVIPSALVTVKLPGNVQITVKEGQKVLAGETSVGEVVGTLRKQESIALL